MKTCRLIFEDGDSVIADFSGSLEEAQLYYMKLSFDLGNTKEYPKSKIIKVVSIEDNP